jgi:hypothetical protein
MLKAVAGLHVTALRLFEQTGAAPPTTTDDS